LIIRHHSCLNERAFEIFAELRYGILCGLARRPASSFIYRS